MLKNYIISFVDKSICGSGGHQLLLMRKVRAHQIDLWSDERRRTCNLLKIVPSYHILCTQEKVSSKTIKNSRYSVHNRKSMKIESYKIANLLTKESRVNDKSRLPKSEAYGDWNYGDNRDRLSMMFVNLYDVVICSAIARFQRSFLIHYHFHLAQKMNRLSRDESVIFSYHLVIWWAQTNLRSVENIS